MSLWYKRNFKMWAFKYFAISYKIMRIFVSVFIDINAHVAIP